MKELDLVSPMGADCEKGTISLNYYVSTHTWSAKELEDFLEAIISHEEIHLVLYNEIDDSTSSKFDNLGKFLSENSDGIPVDEVNK